MSKIIYCDTRQKDKSHTLKELGFQQLGYELLRTKLECGDYQMPMKAVTIDTKKDINELVMDITKDHIRFRNELMLAQKVGKKMYILVEEKGYWSLENIHLWQSPKYKYGAKKGKPITSANMETMQKVLKTMAQKYNCTFLFCDPKDSARIIIQILERGN